MAEKEEREQQQCITHADFRTDSIEHEPESVQWRENDHYAHPCDGRIGTSTEESTSHNDLAWIEFQKPKWCKQREIKPNAVQNRYDKHRIRNAMVK